MITYVHPEDRPPPVGQYSQIALVPASAQVAHVAGQLSVDETGTVLDAGDFAAQAERVFSSLAANLEAVGSSMRQIASLRAYLVSDSDFPAFRTARRTAFQRHRVTQPPPATTVVVAGLYGGALFELEAMAVVSGCDTHGAAQR
jgi:enamine deaminase RidA (YjgF/YER057c/UK114 family)